MTSSAPGGSHVGDDNEWIAGLRSSGDADDLISCTNALAAYFRFADTQRYDLLDAVAAPDITLEVEPAGTRRIGLDSIVAGIRSQRPEEWFYRAHIHHNLMMWRASSTEILATARCLHFAIKEPSVAPQMTLTNASDAKYTFRREPDGWKLARRQHVTRFPVP